MKLHSLLVFLSVILASPAMGKIEIKLSSLLVKDQAHALDFYTKKLGFVKKTDRKIGKVRWVTVASSSEGVELALEPTGIAAVETYQKALYKAKIPLTAFATKNIKQEYERLSKLGVKFLSKPQIFPGDTKAAIFDDTCGNFIMLYEEK